MAGSGRVRKRDITGSKDAKRDSGNGLTMISEPGAGVEPEEASATILVYIWANFPAPVSISRAWRCIICSVISREEGKRYELWSTNHDQMT